MEQKVVLVSFIVGVLFGWYMNGSVYDVYHRATLWFTPIEVVQKECDHYLTVDERIACYDYFGKSY